ncbi:hypothetical protein C8Q73DRAFT_95594 [Cubamyces lactineus]|nr:hypothetical protein C8Q73DRAFT_95594 [Cubamyces lactineus]
MGAWACANICPTYARGTRAPPSDLSRYHSSMGCGPCSAGEALPADEMAACACACDVYPGIEMGRYVSADGARGTNGQMHLRLSRAASEPARVSGRARRLRRSLYVPHNPPKVCQTDGSAWRLSHPPVLGHLQHPLSVSYPPMSSSSASSSSSSSSSRSPSPVSSLSSASLAAWSRPILLTHTSMSTAQTSTAGPTRTSVPGPAPLIASLPSLAHSLSAFPTMTVVTNDMVHYGTLGRTKGASEAKLTSALRRTKQRQDAGPGAMVSTHPRQASVTAPRLTDRTCPLQASTASARAAYPTPEDDEPVLLIVPKRSKASKQSS